MRVRETTAVRLVLGDDGIIETTPLDPQRTPRILSEIALAIADIGRGGPRPMIWDPTGTLPLPPQGWHVIVNNIEAVVNALAIIVAEEDVHLLGSFPEAMDTFLVPVRVFNTKEEAREWLHQHVDSDLSTDELRTREGL